MNIMFVTDYVCPYCIVAKTALKQALEQLGVDYDLYTQPFELTPITKPQVDTYNDPVRKQHYKVLDEPMKLLELDLTIPPNVVPRPYTHLAFLGYYYALSQNKADSYSDNVYNAYFKDQKDIGDIEILKEIAIQSDLDADEFEKALSSEKYEKLLAQANKYDREVLNIKHVPTIYFDGKEVSVEHYTKEEFIKLINEGLSKASTMACGIDGCN